MSYDCGILFIGGYLFRCFLLYASSSDQGALKANRINWYLRRKYNNGKNRDP
jgi:hypothetical protein